MATWCVTNNRIALPMHHNTLTEFVRVLTDTVSARTGEPYSVSSLDQAVAAIRSVHTATGFDGMPGTTEARKLINAHGKQLRRRQRKSAVLDKIEQWEQVLAQKDCDPTTPAGMRNRALVIYSLNLFTRRSELAQLHLSDVTEITVEAEDEHGRLHEVPALEVYFSHSKTDQKGEGTSSYLLARDDEFCPVKTHRAWIALLAQHGITEGHLMRGFNRWGNFTPSLSGDSINRLTKQILKAAGYLTDPNGRTFTSHGWRASAYTVAKKHGATDEELHAAGRWSPKSQAAKGYGRSRTLTGGALGHVKKRAAPGTMNTTTSQEGTSETP
ncbi:hypothetical protein [Streptomyces sp. CS014]|uniref:hypothetical protein n=1 Tax=Streptomyces sp. CS014 TaxID=2162707 RepID=UPI000D51413B|nr:hypothetical protein [Streptomyces sp. CS014]PVD04488.1 hypothetical protein DBP12_03420 [Streptomyces sp. CS014]